MKKNDKDIRASTSVCVKFFPFCTFKTYFFYFIYLFLQNTYISLSIIHIYSNKNINFFNIVNSNRERREKVRWREEREKKNKKIIYTMNSNHVYIYGYCLPCKWFFYSFFLSPLFTSLFFPFSLLSQLLFTVLKKWIFYLNKCV